jgi:hypothetical protein
MLRRMVGPERAFCSAQDWLAVDLRLVALSVKASNR